MISYDLGLSLSCKQTVRDKNRNEISITSNLVSLEKLQNTREYFLDFVLIMVWQKQKV